MKPDSLQELLMWTEQIVSARIGQANNPTADTRVLAMLGELDAHVEIVRLIAEDFA